VQLVTTILKLVPLLLIAVGGIFFIKLENFVPFNISGTSNFAAITATAAMTLYAFLGVECATIPAGDVADPEKTIPRATMLGTIITTLVYILGTVSVMGIIPAKELQHSVTPFSDVAVKLWGGAAHYWVGAGVAIAGLGALNGWILIQGQIPYAVAKDKLFPSIFAKQNKKGVPAAAVVISSVLASVLMVMNFTKGLVEQFKFLLLLSTLTSLVPYLFSMAAYVIIRLEKKHLHTSGWFGAIVLASLAFAYSLWAIAGSGQETVFWGFILLLAGVPFYVWIIWKRK
jgi:APA family basic amino acid/polyamine antiporter